MEESKDDRSVFKLKKEKWHERDNGGLKNHVYTVYEQSAQEGAIKQRAQLEEV